MSNYESGNQTESQDRVLFHAVGRGMRKHFSLKAGNDTLNPSGFCYFWQSLSRSANPQPSLHTHCSPSAKFGAKGTGEYSFLRFYPRWATPHTTVLVTDLRSSYRIKTALGFSPSSIDHRKEQWDGYCISGVAKLASHTAAYDLKSQRDPDSSDLIKRLSRSDGRRSLQQAAIRADPPEFLALLPRTFHQRGAHLATGQSDHLLQCLHAGPVPPRFLGYV